MQKSSSLEYQELKPRFFTDEYRFHLERNSRRVKICKKKNTYNKAANICERHRYKSRRIMVWVGIKLNRFTAQSIFNSATVNARDARIQR